MKKVFLIEPHLPNKCNPPSPTASASGCLNMAACCFQAVQHLVRLGGLILTRRGYASRSLRLFQTASRYRGKADNARLQTLCMTLMKQPEAALFGTLFKTVGDGVVRGAPQDAYETVGDGLREQPEAGRRVPVSLCR
ncbi:MAG: hypothetical protein LBD24_05475 [Spirochaetaceae bacterium]|nr:hypothetical protein [Spirochaetaceae bacterium]